MGLVPQLHCGARCARPSVAVPARLMGAVLRLSCGCFCGLCVSACLSSLGLSLVTELCLPDSHVVMCFCWSVCWAFVQGFMFCVRKWNWAGIFVAHTILGGFTLMTVLTSDSELKKKLLSDWTAAQGFFFSSYSVWYLSVLRICSFHLSFL